MPITNNITGGLQSHLPELTGNRVRLVEDTSRIPTNSSMRNVLAEHGLTPEDITSMYTMFSTYQVRQKMMQGKS